MSCKGKFYSVLKKKVILCNLFFSKKLTFSPWDQFAQQVVTLTFLVTFFSCFQSSLGNSDTLFIHAWKFNQNDIVFQQSKRTSNFPLKNLTSPLPLPLQDGTSEGTCNSDSLHLCTSNPRLFTIIREVQTLEFSSEGKTEDQIVCSNNHIFLLWFQPSKIWESCC